MSSMIFQPLLHDPLGWKPSKSTYVDHYKWRKYRTTSKDRKISTYGQRYQRELQKKTLPTKPTDDEQIIDRVILEKKQEDQSARTYRLSPSKTPALVVEYEKRPVSANEEKISDTKLPQRPPTAPPTVEEKSRTPAKVTPSFDPNNDNNRHWLTYPNPKTPQYIIDIKERLGQLRIPPTLARPTSASNQDKKPATPAITRPSSASTQSQQKSKTDHDQHDFLTIPNRQTPEELRAARYRIDKHRYHPSLDSYPPRPQTCPVRPTESIKPVTSDDNENKTPAKTTDAWIVNDDEKQSFVSDIDTGSFVVQMIDCDGLPTEYADALETSNLAQEEYQRSIQHNGERRHENYVYRLPETTNDSYNASQNPRPMTTEMNSQLRQVVRTAQNDFGVWVRNATDKERESAMKLLNEVLNQPVIGYENPRTNNKPIFKQPPVPSPVRTVSATRKLGRTRTQHKFPCEICEKLLIKRHVWDLSGSETLTCPQHPQGIQVRS